MSSLMKFLWLAAVLGIALAGPSWAEEITAVKAGRLFDPESGKLLLNQVILIDGARIKAVGQGLEIPAGAHVIDLSRATVLPGLFDTHTHLCSNAELFGRTSNEVMDSYLAYALKVPTAYRALQGVANARSMLEAGFTTVRDLGNAGDYGDVALRDAIDNGLVPGPAMYVSGKIIAPFGGQFKLGTEEHEKDQSDYITADTRDEIRKAIRQNIHFGANWIKVVSDDQKYSYSEDDFRFIVAEAAEAGRKVAVHCIKEECVRRAAAAGVGSIEHVPSANDEALFMLKDRDVVLVGTEMPLDVLTQLRLDFYYTQFIDRLKRAHSIGVKMAFGSDIYMRVPGKSRGAAAMSVIDSWVEAGVPSLDLLRAMTINAAQLLGDKRRGAIKPGMMADLVAMNGNPLENIQLLKNVVFVMRSGSVVKNLSTP